jgi:hypothetical protein
MAEESKPQEPEYEIKQVKKTRITQIKTHNLTPELIDSSLIVAWKNIEKNLLDADNLIKGTNNARNEVERKIYANRSKINDEWREYATTSEYN